MTNQPVSMSRSRTVIQATDIALIATFAALVVVASVLPAVQIGGLVPITLQTFAVLLSGVALGALRGFLAVLLYLALGLVGLPVFAGGLAGLAPFAGPTVGYLVSFPLAAALAGFLVTRLPRTSIPWSIASIVIAGLVATVLVIHPLGVLGLAWRTDMTLGAAFIFNLTFVPGDVIKVVLAAMVGASVHRAFPALLPRRA